MNANGAQCLNGQPLAPPLSLRLRVCVLGACIFMARAFCLFRCVKPRRGQTKVVVGLVGAMAITGDFVYLFEAGVAQGCG